MDWCCDEMRDQVEHVCPDHGRSDGCPDKLVWFIPKFREYGLIIHDGPNPSSAVVIAYCPWCGTVLPSERNRWFDELDRRGIEDPEDAPVDMQTAAWLDEE